MASYFFSSLTLVCALVALGGAAGAAESRVPEPFRGFDASSEYSINYDDLTALLKLAVVDVGRSSREKSAATQAKTGTRLKAKVRRLTAKEGNRFYFELFGDSEAHRETLVAIQESLEQLPGEAPLKYFSREEQLAYWLNLYNVTVLNEIIKVYPKRELKDLLEGKDSILSAKLLEVAGIPLSLDDIQFSILKENYGNDPLIMYGLYQGIVGGPNIRKQAYTGQNVYRSLRSNAAEFINSNRGTYARNAKVFRVSSLYRRNQAYFDDFEAGLKAHLLGYLEAPEHDELQAATTIKPDISDWTVTDLYGTYRQYGGSIADNSAALIGAMQSTMPADGGPVTSVNAIGSAALVEKAPTTSRFSPELLVHLKTVNRQREAAAAKNARVTVEELGAVSTAPEEDDRD